MKTTKIRTLIAAGTIGAIGLTGVVAANAAGAVGTGGNTTPAKARLTAEQKTCMTEQGITKPEGRPTVEQRAAIIDAAKNCGIDIPSRRARIASRLAQLTPEQRECLVDNGVTRPQRPLTAEQRAEFKQQLKTAAQTCGISR
jgi:hypothetical protein